MSGRQSRARASRSGTTRSAVTPAKTSSFTQFNTAAAPCVSTISSIRGNSLPSADSNQSRPAGTAGNPLASTTGQNNGEQANVTSCPAVMSAWATETKGCSCPDAGWVVKRKRTRASALMHKLPGDHTLSKASEPSVEWVLGQYQNRVQNSVERCVGLLLWAVSRCQRAIGRSRCRRHDHVVLGHQRRCRLECLVPAIRQHPRHLLEVRLDASWGEDNELFGRRVTGVPEGMQDAPRHEDKRPGRRAVRLPIDEEGHLPLQDVERLVPGAVQVQRRTGRGG